MKILCDVASVLFVVIVITVLITVVTWREMDASPYEPGYEPKDEVER